MRVTSFIGPNSTWAFTGTEAGGNLPAHGGPWLRYKQYNMHRGQKLKMAVDVDWIIDAVEGGGYYLTTLPTRPGPGQRAPANGTADRGRYRIGPVMFADAVDHGNVDGVTCDPRNAAPSPEGRHGKKRQMSD